MARLSAKLRSAGSEIDSGIVHWCPGCDCPYYIRTRGAGPWTWDGSVESPTVSPSDAGRPRSDGRCAPAARCHYFLRAGFIEFQGDSTHVLSGRSVPLPDWP